MTDNQIIKALERCPQHTECCYCNSLEECGNKRILTTSVFDLINRQKAEVEKLNIELQSMRSAANSYKMHYEKAQTEINKLKQENDFFRKTITENAQRALEVTVEEIEKAKSEAIKELCEKRGIKYVEDDV